MTGESNELIIQGCGGHARVLLAALAIAGKRPVGCLSPKAPGSCWPAEVKHMGGDEVLRDLDPRLIRLVNGIGSTGTTQARRAAFERGQNAGFHYAGVVHPTAHVAAGVELGEGAQVMAGAVLQTGVRLNANVIVNSGAVVDHDCTLGAHCHVATGARLSGAVTLEDGVHIGTGAVVIQGIRIGASTVVGAGTVVVRDIAPGLKVVGNPARALPPASTCR